MVEKQPNIRFLEYLRGLMRLPWEMPPAILYMIAKNAIGESSQVRALIAEIDANVLPIPVRGELLPPASDRVFSECYEEDVTREPAQPAAPNTRPPPSHAEVGRQMPFDWSNHYPRLTIVEQPPEPLCSLWHTSGDTPNVEMLEIAEPLALTSEIQCKLLELTIKAF